GHAVRSAHYWSAGGEGRDIRDGGLTVVAPAHWRCSDADGPHPARVITLSNWFRNCLVYACQICWTQAYFCRDEIFFQIFHALGAHNRNDVRTLVHYPGESKLRRSKPLIRGKCFDTVDKLEVVREVCVGESRLAPPEVVLRQILPTSVPTGQEP